MKTTNEFNFEYTELSKLESESINGGRRRGRIRRKIKRFFKKIPDFFVNLFNIPLPDGPVSPPRPRW